MLGPIGEPFPEVLIGLEAFEHEVKGASNRAVAIFGAAVLDEALRLLIESFLVDDRNIADQLLGSDENRFAPLNSISARILCANCLGLISKEEKDDLNLIRRIRNDFAHEARQLSFASKEVSDRCQSLKYAKRILNESFCANLNALDLFVVSTHLLASTLSIRALSFKQAGSNRCRARS